MRTMHRLRVLLMACVLIVFGAALVAAVCDPPTSTVGQCVQVSDRPFCQGGSGGGGGAPAPTPTPDPYLWINDLPRAGQTATYYTTWCEADPDLGCLPIPLYWYGVGSENYVTLDASTFRLKMLGVYMEFWVYNAAPWTWDATIPSEQLYTQHTPAGIYPIDLTCPAIRPGNPPNMVGTFGCREIQTPVVLTGENARLQVTLYTLDLNARYMFGTSTISFLHKSCCW